MTSALDLGMQKYAVRWRPTVLFHPMRWEIQSFYINRRGNFTSVSGTSVSVTGKGCIFFTLVPATCDCLMLREGWVRGGNISCIIHFQGAAPLKVLLMVFCVLQLLHVVGVLLKLFSSILWTWISGSLLVIRECGEPWGASTWMCILTVVVKTQTSSMSSNLFKEVGESVAPQQHGMLQN